MTAQTFAKLAAIAAVCGLIFSACVTAPALWWLSDADFERVASQVERQQGMAAAAYIRALRH